MDDFAMSIRLSWLVSVALMVGNTVALAQEPAERDSLFQIDPVPHNSIPPVLYPTDWFNQTPTLQLSTRQNIDASFSHGLTNKPFDQRMIDAYSQSQQNKSFDQLIDGPSISKDPESQKRKLIASIYFNNTFKSQSFPDNQVMKSFLVHENFEVKPELDFFMVNASERYNTGPLRVNQQLILVSPENRLIEQGDLKPKRMKEELLQTHSGSNTGRGYENGYTFKNEVSGYEAKLPQGEVDMMRVEAKDCLGRRKRSGVEGSVDRAKVYKCFVFFNRDLFKEMGYKNSAYLQYLITLSLLTTIVDRKGNHVCMASYYDKNTWITANHCVTDTWIESMGISILANGKKVPITKAMRRECAKQSLGCDVARIIAPTPNVSTDNIVLRGARSTIVTEKTDLFIPGIEVETPIYTESGVSFDRALMWADVGKAYCRVYKVEAGCFSHTCSTLTGFSGAPVYLVNAEDQKIYLIGIHTGDDQQDVSCKTSGTNYAVSPDLFEG
ncbi:hypothetical protein [Ectopseudomonas khazarica]|uniref:hypothetical protein n=1 Tax=Ectopseudomonas khazarica TaxID=2502979 RepID=UPI003A8EEE01